MNSKRDKYIKVILNSKEKNKIFDTACTVKLSASAFLRAVGLGFEPKPIEELKIKRELIKAAADQGRLGGLFKMALSGDMLPDELIEEVRVILNDIEYTQFQIKKFLRNLR